MIVGGARGGAQRVARRRGEDAGLAHAAAGILRSDARRRSGRACPARSEPDRRAEALGEADDTVSIGAASSRRREPGRGAPARSAAARRRGAGRQRPSAGQRAEPATSACGKIGAAAAVVGVLEGNQARRRGRSEGRAGGSPPRPRRRVKSPRRATRRRAELHAGDSAARAPVS